MPRIIVMSDPSIEREGAVTLDERVTSANLRSGHDSAQLIERVGCSRRGRGGARGGRSIRNRPMNSSAAP